MKNRSRDGLAAKGLFIEGIMVPQTVFSDFSLLIPNLAFFLAIP